MRLVQFNMLKLFCDFFVVDSSKGVLLLWILFVIYVSLLSLLCCLVCLFLAALWLPAVKADLLALFCVMFSCVFSLSKFMFRFKYTS